MNPSLDRRWIQVHGLPLDSLTATVRATLDLANSTKVADGAQRVVLFDADDKPICAIDFAPQHFQTINQARPEVAQPVHDPRPGDTIIKPISAKEAEQIGQARDYFDPDREVPPIDLPDYDPHAGECSQSPAWRTPAIVAVVIFFLALIAAKVIGFI